MTNSHAEKVEEIVRLTRELHKANVAGARVTEAYKALRGRESPGHRDATTDSYDLADWPYPPEWDAQQEYVESLERERDELHMRLTAALESLRCASMTNADVMELRERANKAEASLAAIEEESETRAALHDMVRQRDEQKETLSLLYKRVAKHRDRAGRAMRERDEVVTGRAAMVETVRNCVEKLRTDPYYRQNGIIIQRILADAIEKSRLETDRAALQEESETHAALKDMVRQRDDAQTLYRTERELRKKAEDRVHDLATGTQAEAVQGEAAWRERALVGEKALGKAVAGEEAMRTFLASVIDHGPLQRFGSNDPSKLLRWVQTVRAEARELYDRIDSETDRISRIVKVAENLQAFIDSRESTHIATMSTFGAHDRVQAVCKAVSREDE